MTSNYNLNLVNLLNSYSQYTIDINNHIIIHINIHIHSLILTFIFMLIMIYLFLLWIYRFILICADNESVGPWLPEQQHGLADLGLICRIKMKCEIFSVWSTMKYSPYHTIYIKLIKPENSTDLSELGSDLGTCGFSGTYSWYTLCIHQKKAIWTYGYAWF